METKDHFIFLYSHFSKGGVICTLIYTLNTCTLINILFYKYPNIIHHSGKFTNVNRIFIK